MSCFGKRNKNGKRQSEYQAVFFVVINSDLSHTLKYGDEAMRLELLFPIHLREAMKNIEELPDLEEIRVRIGQPLFVCTGKKEIVLVQNSGQTASWMLRDSRELNIYEDAYRITEQDVLEMQNYISNYSLYAWQEELRNGFVTIQGGHRIGLAGGTTNHDGHISGISYLTFFNIRVAHEKIGCADGIVRFLREYPQNTYSASDSSEETVIHNTLIISLPGAGKTTLLRDCIRNLSYGGIKVGLVDERSEIAASYHGIPQNDVGPRTDVLDGCNKPEGIQMLLRTMSPEVIAVDELGTDEDFKAVEQAAYSGCKVIGTVHAGSIKELQEKAILKKWCEKELFERFIFIKKGENGVREFKVYNNRWELLC